MSSVKRVMAFVVIAVSVLGCGQSPTTPPRQDSQPVPRVTTQTTAKQDTAPLAKEDLTPPDDKPAKVDFRFNGVDFTIEMPEGAEVHQRGELRQDSLHGLHYAADHRR
jgi:hypothetical protein